jgi:hypothetical protein
LHYAIWNNSDGAYLVDVFVHRNEFIRIEQFNEERKKACFCAELNQIRAFRLALGMQSKRVAFPPQRAHL